MAAQIGKCWIRQKSTTVVLILVGGGGLLFGAVHYRHRTAPVPTLEVKSGEFLDTLQLRGEVAAIRSVTISAPAKVGDLQILKIAADGTQVRPGDTVVELDTTKTEQQLAQYRSSLKYATADIEQERAKARLTEEQDLTAVLKARYELESNKLDASKQEIVSKIEGAEAQLKVKDGEQALHEAEQKLKSDRDASKASIQGKIEARKKAEFDVQQAEEALSQMVIRAPVAGMLSLIPVWHPEGTSPFKPGDHAWPGAPLAEIPESSSLRVALRVDETDRGRLAVKQPVTVHLDAIPDRQFSGAIEEISTIATEDFSAGWPIPRNFHVHVAMNESDPRLKLGMTAQLSVIVDRVANAVVIPVQASFQKQERTLAYVWTGSKFIEQTIEVGRRSGDRLLIAKGLQPGDRIALEEPVGKGR
jgi:HlyD family secretion protein